MPLLNHFKHFFPKKTASRWRGWLFEEQAGMPVSRRINNGIARP
jgi:hypothetical protein